MLAGPTPMWTRSGLLNEYGWRGFTIRWHLSRAGAGCGAAGACSLRLGERPHRIAERMDTGCARRLRRYCLDRHKPHRGRSRHPGPFSIGFREEPWWALAFILGRLCRGWACLSAFSGQLTTFSVSKLEIRHSTQLMLSERHARQTMHHAELGLIQLA